jgi:hypothetical protein
MLMLLAVTATAQTSLNPDISVVGDFRAYSHNDNSREDEAEKPNLADPSMELVASGYLNPYARADVIVGWHGEHAAEIEEVYATILRGLPFGMNLKIGKYLLEFGRLNPVHEHAWSFLYRPLPHTAFFGEEGLNGTAVRTSFLLPTGEAYTELMFAVLDGDLLVGHHNEEESETEDEHSDETESSRRDLGFFGRLTTSLAVARNSELALGGSVVNAVHGFAEQEEGDTADPEQLRAWITGLDFKYKYKPSRYTSLQIEGEGIVRTDEQHEGDNLRSYGGYAYLDYRFGQKYNLGGIFEYTRVEEADQFGGGQVINRSDIQRYGLFVGLAPIEETSLVRLAGHWTETEEGDGFWEVDLQFVFSLGPHQPHNF